MPNSQRKENFGFYYRNFYRLFKKGQLLNKFFKIWKLTNLKKGQICLFGLEKVKPGNPGLATDGHLAAHTHTHVPPLISDAEFCSSHLYVDPVPCAKVSISHASGLVDKRTRVRKMIKVSGANRSVLVSQLVLF